MSYCPDQNYLKIVFVRMPGCALHNQALELIHGHINNLYRNGCGTISLINYSSHFYLHRKSDEKFLRRGMRERSEE